MNLAQDLRFAFRLIRKNFWFSAAIVLTLALGIGVNTTVFSLVNAALRKPLPFPGGERLAIVRATNPSRGNDSLNLSCADFRDFRSAAGSFERLEAFSGLAVNISERANPPDRYSGGRVTSGMFEMLRTKPVIGRGIFPSDEKLGAAPVLLIGYGVWVDRYGKDPNILGRSVRANNKPAAIVGVMPKGFKFPNNEDIWMAAIPDAELAKRNNRAFLMVGMLKEGTSIAEAQADLSIVAKRLEEQFPDSHKNHGISVQTFHQAMNGGGIRLVFLLLLGAVGFVLLIACANVANMLLSKAVGRSREISIRAALGARRWRLVRQLLVESIVLAILMRARGPVASLATALRREVQRSDAKLPLFEVQSLEERFQRSRWYLRVFGTLFSVFASIALGMAAVGIYAVMAHSTGQRRQEIGVRVALGADFVDVLRLVLGRGVKQLMIGAIIGLAAAISVCRLMARILFKVAPNDVLTLALVTLALLTVGLTACWFPARRAAKLDPVKALRYE
jgi:ABC-type antimicrobial peptide transport system permease subunit